VQNFYWVVHELLRKNPETKQGVHKDWMHLLITSWIQQATDYSIDTSFRPHQFPASFCWVIFSQNRILIKSGSFPIFIDVFSFIISSGGFPVVVAEGVFETAWRYVNWFSENFVLYGVSNCMVSSEALFYLSAWTKRVNVWQRERRMTSLYVKQRFFFLFKICWVERPIL